MKTVFITGISRGLGKELFNLFASENYFVYGVLRNPFEAEELKKNIPENSKIIIADLASDKSIELIQQTVNDSPIDLLINNAGIGGSSHQVHNIESTEIIDLFNIHCLGVFRTVKALKKNYAKKKQSKLMFLG